MRNALKVYVSNGILKIGFPPLIRRKYFKVFGKSGIIPLSSDIMPGLGIVGDSRTVPRLK